MSEVCVVHLVRKKNGMEPFLSFIESYLKNPAGMSHDLLILYKGFFRQCDIAAYEALLKDIPHSYLQVADFGFDLRPYFIAAERYDSRYFCFLNSFSIILDRDWLLKLYRHIVEPGVGIVGASGSWGCIRPGQVRNGAAWYRRWLRHFVLMCLGRYLGSRFDAFPNFHIRSNGFMIARANMLKIRHGMILSKMQAWMLESGKNGITKQIEQAGLKPIVVGKDGRAYGKYEWKMSNTFWRGEQENLLIADNQTRKFDSANSDWKRSSELFAWGE